MMTKTCHFSRFLEAIGKNIIPYGLIVPFQGIDDISEMGRAVPRKMASS
jgi:hypothetical protein